MTFTKEAEGALVPVLLEKYGQEAAAASSGGKTRRTGRDSLLDKIS